MMRWANLIKYHLNAPSRNVLVRHPIVQSNYELHKQQNRPLDKYITEKYLRNKLNWLITDNKFPYYLDGSIKHKVLWIKPHLSMNEQIIHKIINRYAKAHGYNKYIYYENPVEARSIPGIRHYHIFVDTQKH